MASDGGRNDDVRVRLRRCGGKVKLDQQGQEGMCVLQRRGAVPESFEIECTLLERTSRKQVNVEL